MIDQLVVDPLSPGTMYDLIGEGQQIGSYCGGNFGVCKCEFIYTQPGIGSQTVDVDNTYLESDLIRCPSSGVPSGIKDFQVRVITVSGATPAGTTPSSTPAPSGGSFYSNTLSVNLAGDGSFASATNYLDLTNAKSFVPAQRFQCRKREFIKNPMDQNIIDPFQSSDPSVIYPFNYYTTNVSDSLLNFQRLGDQSWECTLTGTQSGALQWWANPNVFSVTPCTTSFCTGDQQLIYPQSTLSSGKIPVLNPAATGKRRASFYLASQAYGVFQIPLKAAVAPVDYVSAAYSVIGYAAKPVPNVNGSSTCPAIPIPANTTWVKLWNFRATDITSPQIVTGSQSIDNSTIACDSQPGVFPSCDTKVPNSGGVPAGTTPFGLDLTSGSISNFVVAPVLSSRLAFISSSVGDPSLSACYNLDTSAWNNLVAGVYVNQGSEIWKPSPFRFSSSFQVSFAVMQGFPWGMYAEDAASTTSCPAVSGNLWLDSAGCGGAPYSMLSAQPTDSKSQLYTQSLAPNGDNFTDQLFVVTDPNVDDSLMRNGSATVSQFVPITFRSKQDCLGPTIDNTCINPPIHWDINIKEVGNSNGADLYPLCVLQFYD